MKNYLIYSYLYIIIINLNNIFKVLKWGEKMIYGNIDGVKKSALEELEALYKAKCPKDEVCSLNIIETISRVSAFIER